MEHRHQYVALGSAISSTCKVGSGVPQGSTLGPLLFNLYINDIVKSCKYAQLIIYTDDTTLLFSDLSVNELVKKANEDLETVAAWAKENQLAVNSRKTKAMLFKSKNKRVTFTDSIRIGVDRIELVKSIKLLGIYFQENMLWDDHVVHVKSKISKVIGMLRRHSYVLPVKAKLTIYNSLFSSYVSYCYLVWGTTSQQNLNTLFVLQKRIIRIIEGVDNYSFTDYLFHKYGIAQIHDLLNKKLISVYNKSIKTNNQCFFHIARLDRRNPVCGTRLSSEWIVPRSRTSYGDQRISYQLATALNRTHLT